MLHGHVPLATMTAQLVGLQDRSQRLNLAIGLPLRNQKALELFLQQLYDPSGSYYRQYLNAEEFAQRFGPREADYQALIQFAQVNGMLVTGTHPNRTILDVSGTVAEIEQAFHLNIMSYWRPDRGTFYAPDREPSLDLNVPVLDISGLDNFQLPKPMGLQTVPVSQAVPDVTGSGPNGLLIGGDFRAAYAPGVTLTGAGQIVGLLELDGFYPSDEEANFARAGLPPVPTQTVLLDGVSGAPSDGQIEVILDIMMASYMAPGLSKVMVYEGSLPDDVLNRMATDNQAKQLSSSWGFGVSATTEQIFLQYIAQGQSLLQASGDGGAYKGPVQSPWDDPNLTVVGGTSLSTSGPGGLWQSESAWSASGGGISTTYSIPAYQNSTNMTSNGGSGTMRNIPDVALTADVQIFLIQGDGQARAVGGTSAAAPLWAGFIALVNQQAVSNGKSPVGFLNPSLYSIGNGSNYSADFHDITRGNNGGFSALPGYDLVTGWGTPAGQSLINDLSAAPAFTLSALPATLSLAAGSSAVSTITVASQNNFSGNVSLGASGLPQGISASFSPAGTNGTSTLTLTAGSSAPGGTATVAITGTSGTLTSTATIGISVSVPSFTLSASPSTLSLTPGTSASSQIAVTSQNRFSGNLTWTAAGLPNGVTASFSPASGLGSSTLTLLASSSVVAGTSVVTITGTSNTLTSTATVGISISVPSFTLSASPNTLSLTPGTSASSQIAVTPQNGFSGNLTWTAAGLPNGVTASFSPTTGPGSSILTLLASSSVVAGTSIVTITGTSGTLTSTATVGISVSVPSFTVANISGNNLSVVDPATGAITASIAVPAGPAGLALSPDGGTLYVASQSANSVSAISTSTNSVLWSAAVGATPVRLAVQPNGGQVYVVNQGANTVSVISPSSHTVVATIPVGSHPSGVTFSPDGTTAYVANVFGGTVSVINAASNSVVSTFAAAIGATAIALSASGTTAYVANEYANTVTVHAVPAGNILATISGFSFPDALALTQNGTSLYVTNGNASTASVVSTASNSIVATIPTGISGMPTSVAISTDGTQAYVVNENTFSVSVIEISTNTVASTIAGVGVDPVAVVAPPPFAAPLCTYSISPGSAAFSSSGGTGTVTVTAPSGCGWTAASNIGWASITSGASGSGSGLVNYQVNADSGATGQNGTLTIAGQPFTVSVAGIPCSYSLSASSLSLGSGGGSGSVTVIAPAACAWTAASNAAWISISSGASGSGSASVAFQASSNTDLNTQTGTLTIAGQTFTITEAGTALVPSFTVANISGNNLSVVDPATGAITASIAVPAGPAGLALSPDGGTLYVASQSANSVSAISTSTNSVLWSAAVGATPVRLAVQPNGGQVYVVNQGANTVSVISPSSHTVVATIPVGSHPAGSPSVPTGPRPTLPMFSEEPFPSSTLPPTA